MTEMNRRDFLRTSALALTAAAACPLGGVELSATYRRLLKYLETCRRDDGGYAWPDQPQSHLTPTWAAVGCYQLLGQQPPNAAAIIQFVRTHHPMRLQPGREQELFIFDYQQIQTLQWLGDDAADLAPPIAEIKKPQDYKTRYEPRGYPIVEQELSIPLCYAMLKLPTGPIENAYLDFIQQRRRDNGTYNHAPARHGGDGHLLITDWCQRGLEALGRTIEPSPKLAEWVNRCLLPDGGITYQPDPPYGGLDDIAYTRAAFHILNRMGAKPDPRAIDHLLSLRHNDDGFSDRPNWPSNPQACYCLLDALTAAGTLSLLDQPLPEIDRPEFPAPPLPDGLKIHAIEIEAHGTGSIADAVEIARACRIDWWGAKNARPEWLKAAQARADRLGVKTKFFVADEEYGSFMNFDPLGSYSHLADVIAPPGADFGKPMGKEKPVAWEDYRRGRIAPLEKAGGRIIWQFNENESLTRALLDDAVMRGGYAAICTFHFGNPDFVNSQPFLWRYRYALPYVALHDAHGGEAWWWSDLNAGARTLYLAKDGSWESWLEALKLNRVVAVRHDAASGGVTWMHGGAPGIQEHFRGRQAEWRWWADAIENEMRPPASLAVIAPGDLFEQPAPETGFNLRIRCRHDNTKQGLPAQERVRLLKLEVDGAVIPHRRVEKRNDNKRISDRYELAELPDATAAPKKIVATLKLLDSGREMKLDFASI